MSSCSDDHKVQGGSRHTAKYGTLHAAAATLFKEGGREEVPSGSLRVAAAAAAAAEWMDGMEGRVAPLAAT